jgi:hypothetical protein
MIYAYKKFKEIRVMMIEGAKDVVERDIDDLEQYFQCI